MTVKATHPSFDSTIDDWTMVRDCYEGETEIKRKRTLYLPATDTMIADGMSGSEELGSKRYASYLKRARFPDYVQTSVDRMVSMINRQEIQVELPPSMQYLIERATPCDETLMELYRMITFEQLLTGRLGLLADFDGMTTNPQPVIAIYKAEAIRNWFYEKNEGLSMVVLDESDYEVNDFVWRLKEQYRVLQLLSEGEGSFLSYHFGLFEDDYNIESMAAPQIRGNTLSYIPFHFINSGDLSHEIGKIPSIGLARICLGIYRSDADYRSNLFMQGQETLVLKDVMRDSDEENVRIGHGSYIEVGHEGDAFYVGVSGNGLSEQRTAIENDRKEAEERSLGLASVADNQSGEALKTRIASQALSLTRVAHAAAGGLEKSLRDIAEWLGLDPESVNVNASIDFRSVDFAPADLNKLMIAKGQGAPMSLKSIHKVLAERGYTKLTFDEEMEELQEELLLNNPGEEDDDV